MGTFSGPWHHLALIFVFVMGALEEVDGGAEKAAPPWAYSVAGLEYLSQIESQIYEHMRGLAGNPGTQTKAFKRWTDDYEGSSLRIVTEMESLEGDALARCAAQHPIMAYKMLRRFSNIGSLRDILRDVAPPSNGSKEISRILHKVETAFVLPRTGDVLEMIGNVIRLMDFYGKDTVFMANCKGQLRSVPVQLSAEEELELGNFALNQKMYPLALDWLQEAHALSIRNQSIQNSMSLSLTIENAIQRLVKEHDGILRLPNLRSERMNGRHIHTYMDKISRPYMERQRELPTFKEHYTSEYTDRGKTGTVEYFNFVALCNGKDFQRPERKASLACYFERSSHPYLILNPVKVEIVSWKEPYVYVMHDFIGHKLADKFMSSKTAKNLVRGDAGTSSPNHPPPRTASSYYFAEREEMTVSMDTRIEVCTGLTMKAGIGYFPGEVLNMASYVNGGHFHPHVDVQAKELLEYDGDRIAVVMIFLNDVTSGGATAFPKIGSSVRPMKGSAVVWYNLLKNQEPDWESQHGGCPVVGEKTVLLQLVMADANFQTKKCSLDPWE